MEKDGRQAALSESTREEKEKRSIFLSGRLLSRTESSFDRGSDRGQHLFGYVGVGAVRLKLEVLLKGLGGAFGRNRLIPLQRSLADHVHAFLVVGVGPIGIGGDGLVEGRDGIVNLAGIGEDRANIVVISRGTLGIHLCGLSIGLHGVIDLAGLSGSLSEVVVVRRQLLGIVGSLLRLHGLLLDVNSLLIVDDSLFEALGFLRAVCLFKSGPTIGIAKSGPDRIAGCIPFGGFG